MPYTAKWREHAYEHANHGRIHTSISCTLRDFTNLP